MTRMLFALGLLLASPALAQVRYFSELSDVPMPPGFEERDAAAGFDSEGGLLVAVAAAGELQAPGVRDFYVESLPQLGWALSPRTDEVLVFQRGRERLTFLVDREDGRTILRAQLVVLPPPSHRD